MMGRELYAGFWPTTTLGSCDCASEKQEIARKS
jgi:hypothetical protein